MSTENPPESPWPLTMELETVTNVIARVNEPAILGLHLLDEKILLIIERDNRHDRCRLAQRIANAWFHSKDNPPTWDKLIKALTELNEQVLAQDVENYYRRGSTTSTVSFFSVSSWNGSELASSGNEDSLMRADFFEQRKITGTVEKDTKTEIKLSFKKLTNKIAEKLEAHKVSVRVIKQNIISETIDNCTRFESRTKRFRKVIKLFGFFEEKKLWDFQHYNLVRQVIDLIEDAECKAALQAAVDAYIKELNGYEIAQKLATKLPYYLDKEYPEVQTEEYESWFCDELRKRLDFHVNITNESLRFISKLWDEIRKRYTIPSLTALLYSLVYGSLVVTWLIQPSWACCILREILTSVAFFQEHLIVKVVLDGECVYEESERENNGITSTSVICSLWLKQASLSGRVEKFQEVFDQPDIHINTVLSKDNATPLMIASSHGHIELVIFLLENGADPSMKLTNGQTALHLAVIKDLVDVARRLHEENNELIGLCDQRGVSPLMEAAGRNNAELVQVFVECNGPELEETEILTLDEAFLLAVKKGHIEIVKILYTRGAKASTVTEDESTALVVAAAAGHTSTVEYLIASDEEKLDQNPPSEEKVAALSAAIEKEHFEIVERLLKSEFKTMIIDVTDDDGMTPLMKAVRMQLPELVEIIAEAGAELDLRNNDGKTALMLAAESGQKEVVVILLKEGTGADINLQQETTGKTALHLASENGHLDVVEELVKPEYKANVALKDTDTRTARDVAKTEEIETVLMRSLSKPRQYFEAVKKWFKHTSLSSKLIPACKVGNLDQIKACLDGKVDPDTSDILKYTGLMWASHNGHADAVELLLNHKNKADPNLKARGDWTALILASRKAHYKVVEHLVNNGADVQTQNWQGFTALMWAACSNGKKKTEEALENQVRTAEILIAKYPAIMDIPANDKFTPLMQASLEGYPKLIDLLTKKGANTELATKRQWTALMFATKHNKKEVVRALVNGGAKVDSQKSDGMTALHIACVKGNTECVETMVESQPEGAAKPNLDVKNKWGMTPLTLATKHGNIKAAEILVKAGASVNVKSEEYGGWSPLFFAIKEGYFELVKLLVNNKANIREKDKNDQTPLRMAFNQRKDIYNKLISFLREKPQVLKAISTAEAGAPDPPHAEATPRPAVSPIEDTPSTQKRESDEPVPVATPPLTDTPTNQAQAETESSPVDEITLDLLIKEAETPADFRAVNFKHLERSYQRDMKLAMQSGSGAAGAA